MKKVLILNGHTGSESLSKHLSETYKNGALAYGNEVRLMNISEMSFDPVLTEGYKERKELESDLLKFQENVLWADHFVVVYPTWWGNMPAILKGLFDRAFLPGFSYKKVGPTKFEGLLKGKSARIITTCGAPRFAFHLVGNTYTNLKSNTLKLCGFSPIKVSIISSSENIPEDRMNRIEKMVNKLGELVK